MAKTNNYLVIVERIAIRNKKRVLYVFGRWYILNALSPMEAITWVIPKIRVERTGRRWFKVKASEQEPGTVANPYISKINLSGFMRAFSPI